jgi:hypothetical protein
MVYVREPRDIEVTDNSSENGRPPMTRVKRPGRTQVMLAAGGIALAGALAGCGDTITANHDWQSVSALVTVSANVGSTTVGQESVLTGVLVDGQQKPLFNTRFQNKCVREGTSGPYRCLALLNAGHNVYVAGGLAEGPFGTLKSLSAPGSPDTMVISKIKEVPIPPSAGNVPPGVTAYLIKISARNG